MVDSVLALATDNLIEARRALDGLRRARTVIGRTALFLGGLGVLEIVLHRPLSAAVLVMTGLTLQLVTCHALLGTTSRCSDAAAAMERWLSSQRAETIRRRLRDDSLG